MESNDLSDHDKFLSMIRGINLDDILLKCKTPVKNWSDDILMQLREKVKFSESSKNRANLKKIISRFYRFYFTGVINAMDTSVAVVADACALARTSEGSIWPDDVFGSDAFYKLNASAEEQISPTNLGALPQLAQLTSGELVGARRQYETLISKYNPDHAVNFAHKVQEILNRIDPTREATHAELGLVKLTGFLALTFWRAATKNKDQLGNAFLKTRYRANLTSQVGWPAKKPFAPPCTQCLMIIELALSKSQPLTSMMFTLLVSEYVRNKRNNNTSNVELLSAAVLTHTAQNGLGIFRLLEDACNATGKEWTELYSYSHGKATAKSWDLIQKFYSTYLDKNNLQYGFNWARIINDGYLQGYSPKEMLPLAAFLAGIIEQQQGPGIWNAKWAKENKSFLSNMRAHGKAFYEMSKVDTTQ